MKGAGIMEFTPAGLAAPAGLAPAVSILMVSYYTGPALWLAIDSALEQPECRELILVDNGNYPAVQAQLEERSALDPRLHIVSGQGNVGFARACNLAARASSSDILLFLNPDSMLPEGGLAQALEALARFPGNTLAGCILVNPDGSEQRGSRRALLTPENALSESLGLKYFKSNQPSLNLHDTPMPLKAEEVPAISGAFMMLPRTFYMRLGGMDEGYFLHMEDMDFCRRVHSAGGKVICMPEIKVIHFRSTSETASGVVERHKARSFIRYLKLYFSERYAPWQFKLLTMGIWLRCWLKTFMASVDRFFIPPLGARREVARIVLLYRLARFGPRDQSLSGRRIIVTGGSGQTGLCVVGQALARGALVTAVYQRNKIPFTHPHLQWVERDLTRGPLGLAGDCLIHTAALWLLPDILEGVYNTGIRRVVAFGSTSMLVKDKSKNDYEKGIAEKLSASERRIGETTAAKRGLLTILRPTLIYGVGLDANITRLADIVRRFGWLAVYGRAAGIRQPVQAIDLGKAALDILENPATFGKAYNIGGNQTMSYRTMLDFIFQYLGKRPRIISIPFLPTLFSAAGKLFQLGYVNGEIARRMNRDLVFDIKDAVQDFDYKPQGYLQGSVTL